jgi:hypothetical protein
MSLRAEVQLPEEMSHPAEVQLLHQTAHLTLFEYAILSQNLT